MEFKMERVTMPDGSKAMRSIATIPSSRAPTPAQRKEIANKLAELRGAGAIHHLVRSMEAVTRLVVGMPSANPDAYEARARTALYVMAVEDLPTFVVVEACRRWVRHDAGPIEEGDGARKPNYEFAPTPPVLRFIALRVLAQLNAQILGLERLLSARIGDPPPPENDKLSAEVREVMAQAVNRVRVPALSRSVAYRDGDGKHAARVAADLAARRARRETEERGGRPGQDL
jgi:hypothetical protein